MAADPVENGVTSLGLCELWTIYIGLPMYVLHGASVTFLYFIIKEEMFVTDGCNLCACAAQHRLLEMAVHFILIYCCSESAVGIKPDWNVILHIFSREMLAW